MKSALNAILWLTASLSLIVGGLIATAFVLMATSLDPFDMISVGTEPWVNAAIAVGAFIGLVASTVLGLMMWRSQRLKICGAILIAVQVALVVKACAMVYAEYM